jgi:hypothetical protein
MFPHMGIAQPRERFSLRTIQAVENQRFRIAADVFVTLVARGGGNENQHGVCITDNDIPVPGFHLAAAGQQQGSRLELQGSLDARCFAILATQDERSSGRFDGCLLWRSKTRHEADLTGTIRSQADHDHLRLHTGKIIALRCETGGVSCAARRHARGGAGPA